MVGCPPTVHPVIVPKVHCHERAVFQLNFFFINDKRCCLIRNHIQADNLMWIWADCVGMVRYDH